MVEVILHTKKSIGVWQVGQGMASRNRTGQFGKYIQKMREKEEIQKIQKMRRIL